MSTTADDVALIVFLSGAGSCSLDSSPGKNWVENSGGLPNYICKIAKGVMKSGKSKSSAIAIAVSRTKVWAAGGGGVDADTKAKAAKAVAEWNALKAKNKAKKVVKASRQDGSEYLQLSNIGSFNTDMIRKAYNDVQTSMRRAARDQAKAEGRSNFEYEDNVPYTYIRELWTDHVIVEVEGNGQSGLAKIPYSVSGSTVSFGVPVEVKQAYVEVEEELSDEELELLSDILVLTPGTPAARIAAAHRKLTGGKTL